MQTPLGFSMHNVSTSHVICGIAMRNTARNWTQGLAQESVARATSRVYRASIAKGVRTETTATYPKRETCPSHDSTHESLSDSIRETQVPLIPISLARQFDRFTRKII